MINAIFLPAKPNVPLDHMMIWDLLKNDLWKPVNHYDIEFVHSFDEAGHDHAVVVLPGAYYKVGSINRKIARFKSCLVILVSDENNVFPVEDLKHPNMKLWVQTPRVGRDYPEGTRFIGVGYAQARKFQHTEEDRDTDVFISGQDTHERRSFIFDALEAYAERHSDLIMDINRTEGFTKGMKPEDYYSMMGQSKVAPAPSGIVSPDSFRVYEALECGVIPIADDISPSYDSKGYWAMLFPHTPMPILGDDNIADIIDSELANYRQRRNQIFAWWQQQKRQYAYDLVEDLNCLIPTTWPEKAIKDRVTVIIPVSPWKEHPDTRILEETIRNAQKQLPGAEIIVTFDGVRPEQTDRYDDYQEFVITMLHKMNREYRNVLPIVMTEHAHQSGMMREALKFVKTQTILYNEGDSPLYADRPIAWEDLLHDIEWGDSNVIRLYNKEEVPPEHEYLMHHEFDVPKLSLIATSQWSQQPHLADTNFYREIMDLSTGYFSNNAKCFIEEKMYYIIASESRNGQWRKWRMFIYKPDNLPRSYHLDGREGGPSFYEGQTF